SRGSSFSGNSFSNSYSGSPSSGRGNSGSTTNNNSSNSSSSSPVVRSFGERTVARPVDGVLPDRNSGNSGTFRGWSQGNASVGDSSNQSSRTFKFNPNNTPQTNRFSTSGPQTGSSNDTSRVGPNFPNTGRDGRFNSSDNNQVSRGFFRQNGNSDSSNKPQTNI